MIGSIRIARIHPKILTVLNFSLAINRIALIIEIKKIKPEIINIQSNSSMIKPAVKLRKILIFILVLGKSIFPHI